MMRHQRIVLCQILFACGLALAMAEEPLFRVERPSERVVLLIENSPMENIIGAVLGSQGIVVVDTGPSAAVSARAREIVCRTFGRSDIAWVINTHGHWDHVFGNSAWAGARFAAHESVTGGLQVSARNLPGTIEGFKRNRADLESRLKALPESSPDRPALLLQRDFNRRNLEALETPGFRLVSPDVTFNDRMTIRCGDLTLNLIHFGPAHSPGDILVHIPEAGLLFTGDLFLDRGWLPLFAGLPALDVPRWIEVLNGVLAPEGKVRTVVPGHRDAWPVEKLALWREYIADLWRAVNDAFRAGRTVDDLIRENPLSGPCLYLKERGFNDAQLKRFQEGNLRAFWRQVAPSAVREIEKSLRQGGAVAAEARFKEMRAAGSGFNFDEREMNQLGYELLGRGDSADAVAVLRMNAELFPASANVHDSLGEALAADGKPQEAIRCYQKALEIDPSSSNARSRLEELRAAEKRESGGR